MSDVAIEFADLQLQLVWQHHKTRDFSREAAARSAVRKSSNINTCVYPKQLIDQVFMAIASRLVPIGRYS